MMTMFLIGSAEVVVGPMMTDMGAHFGVPAAQIAWIPSIYALVYAVVAIGLGPLSDRFGRKALLLPGLIGFAVSMAALPFAPGFELALAAAALAGLSAGAMQPNALAIVNDVIRDPTRQVQKLGQVFLGLTFSFIATPVVAALLASRVDWRLAFLGLAVIGLVVAVLILRMPVPRASAQTKRLSLFAAFGAALAVPTARARLASSYLWIGLSIGVLAVLAEILRRRYGLSTEAVGLIVGAFGVATLIGNSLVGQAIAWIGTRQRLTILGAVACALGPLVVGVLPPVSLPIAVCAVIIWAFVYGAAAPAHHGLLSGLSDQHRGTLSAMNASLLNLGIVTVTFASGRLFDSMGVEVVLSGAVIGILVAGGLLAHASRSAQPM
jgi:predicted MFS family arabinose efflux permease